MARGVILTGRLGAGKTTALRSAAAAGGVVLPETTTTRAVCGGDIALRGSDEATFVGQVRAGRLKMPMRVGENYYAWEADQFELLRSAPRVLLAVRPYTALCLSAFLSDLQPVWLKIEDALLEARLLSRGAARDLEDTARREADREDASYEKFFPESVDASDTRTVVTRVHMVMARD